ncbi:MAG: hypothetical protein LBJ40_24160 [Delftia acidovorans]|uniref:hypothetical protein n=1 Tax=Delftia acidovorans TaxID=80866 RepID=UPI0028334C5B|nr:hypothetical protein [Delftia acidovorans]MDR3017193.1 hypothetical protein [Delftia acidovorans]
MSAPSPDSMARLVATRTLDKYERDYYPKRDRITISFRGDLAEQYNYDKIQPLSEARRHGHQVVIEATSQKTGATGHYCIECNSWNLIEAVGTWAPGEEAPAAD